MKHLVFYDGECGFCDRMVQFLLQVDKNRIFVFAPLQGKTAEKFLQTLSVEERQADSIILVEDFNGNDPKVYLYGKAVFRIFWLLGSFWKIPGLLFFFPAFLYNFGYRFVARHRKEIFPYDQCVIPNKNDKDRFLD